MFIKSGKFDGKSLNYNALLCNRKGLKQLNQTILLYYGIEKEELYQIPGANIAKVSGYSGKALLFFPMTQ